MWKFNLVNNSNQKYHSLEILRIQFIIKIKGKLIWTSIIEPHYLYRSILFLLNIILVKFNKQFPKSQKLLRPKLVALDRVFSESTLADCNYITAKTFLLNTARFRAIEKFSSASMKYVFYWKNRHLWFRIYLIPAEFVLHICECVCS